MKVIILFFFMISSAFAFTLNNNFGAAFSKDKVKISIASQTTCNNAGTTIYELHDLIGPAVDDFWNRVATSRLRLVVGGYVDGVANINGGRLCSPTDSVCISGAAGNLIPPVSQIVIGCNANTYNFEDNNILAVTIPNNFSGKKINGSVILINDSMGSAFANLSREDKISVLSHEIGHAIGLGHSEDTAALMYYQKKYRRALGQDDVDGVSWLYPAKMDGCGLFSGTVDTDKIDPQFWQLGIGFMFIFLFAWIRKLFHRSKARASA